MTLVTVLEYLSARVVLVDGLELLFVEVWLSKPCS